LHDGTANPPAAAGNETNLSLQIFHSMHTFYFMVDEF